MEEQLSHYPGKSATETERLTFDRIRFAPHTANR